MPEPRPTRVEQLHVSPRPPPGLRCTKGGFNSDNCLLQFNFVYKKMANANFRV